MLSRKLEKELFSFGRSRKVMLVHTFLSFLNRDHFHIIITLMKGGVVMKGWGLGRLSKWPKLVAEKNDPFRELKRDRIGSQD